MVHRLTRRAVALAVPIALMASPAMAGTFTGPNSSAGPYLVPTQPSIHTKSILTVGDTPANSDYKMAGIPDGLGAYNNNYDGTFTILMNHELGESAGGMRAHGAKGAFVSKYIVRKHDLAVLSGEDLIKQVYLADGNSTPDTYAFRRLCSADLAEASAFFHKSGFLGRNSVGYKTGRIFLNGEETGSEGKAFAHISGGPDNGKSYELPSLGKLSYENSVANPATGNATVVVNLDDSTPGQVYVYVGSKKDSGSPVDKAGLTGGNLFGIKVPTLPLFASGSLSGSEDSVTPITDNTSYPFTGAPLGDVSGITGGVLETNSTAAGVTKFARPEDGAWDPNNPKDFYFVTTGAIDRRSRLWKLSFVDPANPALGGSLKMLLEGPVENVATSAGPKMMDNMSVDKRGKIMLQEDPGGNPYVAGVFEYDIKSDTVRKILEFDRAKFDPATAGSNLLTQDEESSGIIPMFDILGKGTYLLDAQVHKAHPDSTLVEFGQLMAMKVSRPSGRNIFPDLSLDVHLEAQFLITNAT